MEIVIIIKEKAVRRGFWIETIGGDTFYCHRAWKNGKKYVVKQKCLIIVGD
jgi:hypothetical protein